MDRVKPEDVQRAFAAIGMSHTRGAWLCDGKCCGLTSLVLEKLGVAAGTVFIDGLRLAAGNVDGVVAKVAETLQLPVEYCKSFVTGWDARWPREKATEGWQDGHAACSFMEHLKLAA